jgi:acetyl-CoA acetyltransferase
VKEEAMEKLTSLTFLTFLFLQKKTHTHTDGIIPATTKVLAKAKMDIPQIDSFEINEAVRRKRKKETRKKEKRKERKKEKENE